MFDFDATKLIVIGLIALLVIGPKELPGVLRQFGQFIGKMRRMAGEFQQQFSDAMRESELAGLKKDMEKLAEDSKVDLNYDLVHQTEREIRESLEKKPGVEPAKVAGPIVNPTPDNDPDNVFAEIAIPPEAPETKSYAPVREVGLDDEPAPRANVRSA